MECNKCGNPWATRKYCPNCGDNDPVGDGAKAGQQFLGCFIILVIGFILLNLIAGT